MSEQKNQSQVNPEVRQRPVWSSTEKLEITGLEFELIYNALSGLANAMGAASAVLNRNVLNGKVGFVFEKPNENGDFQELSADEAKPYEDQLAILIQKAKDEVDKPQPEPQQEDTLKIVE